MYKSTKISVIMPVKNAEAYISEAINSILSQSFDDFEFLIINDDSTDRTIDIINGYNDTRIKLYSREHPGLAAILNFGIKKSTGEYIARMDADDIALPDRFMQQLHFMEQNPAIGICGTRVIPISDTSHYDTNWGNWLKTEPKIIDLFGPVVFCHPTVMIRRSLINKYDLYYNETIQYAEDQDLWFRAIKVTTFHNLENKLLKYRIHKKSSTTINEVGGNLVVQDLKEDLCRWLGIEEIYINAEQQKIHGELSAALKISDYERTLRSIGLSRWVKLGKKLGFMKKVQVKTG